MARYREVIRDMKRRRLEAGVTQRHFAELAGITPEYLCRLERGTRRARPTVLRILALVLQQVEAEAVRK